METKLIPFRVRLVYLYSMKKSAKKKETRVGHPLKIRESHSRSLNTKCIVPAVFRLRAIWIRVRITKILADLPKKLD